MASRKGEHLGALLRQKLGLILQREAADPRFQFVTITEVGLSRDRSVAKVSFSCFDAALDAAELTAALNAAAGYFQRILARTLQTRRTPQLVFRFDRGFEYSDQIEQKLKELRPLDD